MILSIFSIPVNLAVGQSSGLDLYLAITPSHIERQSGTHNIGYVSLINKQGISVSDTQNTEIFLSSSDPQIATVPKMITLDAGSKFVQFPVTTSGQSGQTVITASIGEFSSSQKLDVGFVNKDIRPGTSLEIVIPSEKMLINSVMPFSVYLKSPDGKFQKAYNDIKIDLEYNDDLVAPDSGSITIKEGSYYALGVLRTKQMTGNGFLHASNTQLDLDSAVSVNVSSTTPSSIQVHVFPKLVTFGADRELDIFISLLDASGNPAIAPDDVELQLISTNKDVTKELDKIIKEEKPMIKKGQFGYHLSHKFDLLSKLENFMQIGAHAKNYGVSKDYFSIVGTTYTPSSEKFTDAEFQLRSLYGDDNVQKNVGVGYDFEVALFGPVSIPPDTESVIGFQTVVLEDNEDDKKTIKCTKTVNVGNQTQTIQSTCPNPDFYEVETDYETCVGKKTNVDIIEGTTETNDLDCKKPILDVDNLPDGYAYPIQSNLSYEKIGRIQDTVSLTTSNSDVIKSVTSRLENSQSSGYAIIKSGSKSGESNIAISISGIGTQTLPVSVIDPLGHNTTKIFSPLGNDKILLDQNGQAEILLIPLDFSDRPKNQIDKISYLLTPSNSILEIKSGESFSTNKIKAEPSPVDNTTEFALSQVGTKLTQATDSKQNFVIISNTGISLTLPNPRLATQENYNLASVQLTDIEGNPVVATSDLPIQIKSSDEKIIKISNQVIIPAGFSYGFFGIDTMDIQGIAKITANGKGLSSTSIDVGTLPSESRLGISLDSIPESLLKKTPTKIKFSVFDSNQKSIEGANVEIYSSDEVEIKDQNIMTDEKGEGTIEITPKSDKSIALSLMVTKEGYLGSSKQLVLDVDKVPGISVSDFQFESWMLYLVIVAIAIVGIFVFLFFRKTKEVVNWEEDI